MARKTNIATVVTKLGKPLMMAVSGATTLGSFAAGAPPFLMLAGAVTGNILSNQVETLPQTFQNFLHRKGRVNHDLQRALALAFEKALSSMERQYLETARWRLTPDELPETTCEVLSDLVSRDFFDKEGSGTKSLNISERRRMPVYMPTDSWKPLKQFPRTAYDAGAAHTDS
ncbi:MAG: hypothetical protein GY801_28825 [bacterium]|nr:hypothetical protein [bacterium]